jgi:hypothetical protein
MSAPLDRGSTVPLCVLCFEAGRATEAIYQSTGHLCGCDQHIQQLEQHGRAAIHRQRKALWYKKADELDPNVIVRYVPARN